MQFGNGLWQQVVKRGFDKSGWMWAQINICWKRINRNCWRLGDVCCMCAHAPTHVHACPHACWLHIYAVCTFSYLFWFQWIMLSYNCVLWDDLWLVWVYASMHACICISKITVKSRALDFDWSHTVYKAPHEVFVYRSVRQLCVIQFTDVSVYIYVECA